MSGNITTQRYLVQIAATFLSRSQSTAFLTDHVTRNGVFVRTDAPPPVMELLRIEFVLPPLSKKVVLHGMVTEVIRPASKNAAPGAEIAFFAKSGEAAQQWDNFITFVREEHPESLVRPSRLAVNATDQVRRAHPRLNSLIPVQLDPSSEDSVTVGNISSGGMFIKTNDAFVVGSDLRVTVQDPRTLAKIAVDCIVRRRAFGTQAGIGVEFRNITDAQRRVLQELMQVAGAVQPVAAHCEEILVPPVRIMATRPGPGAFGGRASIAPSEGSWEMVDEGWPTV